MKNRTSLVIVLLMGIIFNTSLHVSAEVTVCYYSKSATEYVVTSSGIFPGVDVSDMNATLTIDAESFAVEISNPIGYMPAGSTLTGTISRINEDEKEINFILPQRARYFDEPGVMKEGVYKIAKIYNDGVSGVQLNYEITDESLTYVMKEDGHIEMAFREDPDSSVYALVIVDNEGNLCGAAESSAVLTPFDRKPLVGLDDTDAESWFLQDGRTVRLLFSSHDVYIKGLFQRFPDVWIHGTSKDKTIIIDEGQYLGIDTDYNFHTYLYTGRVLLVDSPFWIRRFFESTGQIELLYQDDSKIFMDREPKNLIVGASGIMFDYLRDPVLTKPDAIIEEINLEKEQESIIYFDMTGRFITKPEKGIFFRIDRHADGTSTVSKIFK